MLGVGKMTEHPLCSTQATMATCGKSTSSGVSCKMTIASVITPCSVADLAVILHCHTILYPKVPLCHPLACQLWMPPGECLPVHSQGQNIQMELARPAQLHLTNPAYFFCMPASGPQPSSHPTLSQNKQTGACQFIWTCLSSHGSHPHCICSWTQRTI